MEREQERKEYFLRGYIRLEGYKKRFFLTKWNHMHIFKFMYSINLYFKYISTFFCTKIFNIGESMADLRKRVIQKKFAVSSITAGIYLKSEIQVNFISIWQ